MRLSFVLALVLPSLGVAQSEDTVRAVERKLADARAAKWVLECEAAGGGFYHAPPKADAKPSLRATNGAVRALKYLGFPLLKAERDKHAKFVLSCYDSKTGAFAEPGGKPDVTITSIGVMAAAELGIPHDKYAKAMDYLKENARTFEEVRIGAAAVEAWGVKECPFDLKGWQKIIAADPAIKDATIEAFKDGEARMFGSVVAFRLRLELQKPADYDWYGSRFLALGQREDGGWGKKGEKASDIETTYRVMRALWLLRDNPKDTNKPPVATDLKAVRKFVESHRNKDSGFAVKPGDASSMSGAYYCAIVSKWLDDMEKK